MLREKLVSSFVSLVFGIKDFLWTMCLSVTQSSLCTFGVTYLQDEGPGEGNTLLVNQLSPQVQQARLGVHQPDHQWEQCSKFCDDRSIGLELLDFGYNSKIHATIGMILSEIFYEGGLPLTSLVTSFQNHGGIPQEPSQSQTQWEIKTTDFGARAPYLQSQSWSSTNLDVGCSRSGLHI